MEKVDTQKKQTGTEILMPPQFLFPVPVPSPIPSSGYIHTLKPNKIALYLYRESPLFT